VVRLLVFFISFLLCLICYPYYKGLPYKLSSILYTNSQTR